MEADVKRRAFLGFVGSGAALPLAAMAQETRRIYRVGFLFPGPRGSPQVIALFNGLVPLGFIEGQNLAIEFHEFGQQIDLVPKFAAELVKAQVDVIVVVGDSAIRAAQGATTTIPILGITPDMIGSGLVNSLARPDGNTTGISILATELDGKRQELLIEAVPGIRRIAALADTNITAPARLQALQDAAHASNVELTIHPIARPEEILAAIDAAKASNAMALNVLASPILFANRQIVMERVAALRLPAIYQWPEMAEEGGFAGYGPRVVLLWRDLMSRQLAKLLRGAKPANLPVEQPTKFELVFNLKTAKALGIDVPPTLLARADTVIE
jgi:putative ABC transport system substrate-binding protein